MKTRREEVTGTCFVWAYPKTEWELSREVEANGGLYDGIMPFKYEITATSSNWRDDSVLVHEFSVACHVPAGIDLVQAAVDTLRAEITRVYAEADKKAEELQKKIDQLALIEFKPEGMI